MRTLPVIERKDRLRKLIGNTPRLRYVDFIETQGEAMYKHAMEIGLEGVPDYDGSIFTASGVLDLNQGQNFGLRQTIDRTIVVGVALAMAAGTLDRAHHRSYSLVPPSN